MAARAGSSAGSTPSIRPSTPAPRRHPLPDGTAPSQQGRAIGRSPDCHQTGCHRRRGRWPTVSTWRTMSLFGQPSSTWTVCRRLAARAGLARDPRPAHGRPPGTTRPRHPVPARLPYDGALPARRRRATSPRRGPRRARGRRRRRSRRPTRACVRRCQAEPTPRAPRARATTGVRRRGQAAHRPPRDWTRHRTASASQNAARLLAAILLPDGSPLRTALDADVSGLDAPGKPDPAIFIAAAHRLGRPPQQCFVVEDSPSGAEAARRVHALCWSRPKRRCR